MRASAVVGRGDALARLRAELTSALGGSGGCVVIEGPAGIGKSRLLAVAADLARSLGAEVAAGAASELDRITPLTPLLSALHNARQPVLDEADLDRLSSPDINRFWLIDWLGERIEDYVRRRPLLITLDDLQWADELTALALRTLVPARHGSPLLWLLARRPVPIRTPVQDALDWLLQDATRMPLAPLSDEAVAAMCADLLGAKPGPSVLELGNPFLVEELLITLHAEGRVRVVDGVAAAEPGGMPVDFVTAVDRRLGDLSDDGRRLLEAGAVLGRPFSLHEAARLLARPEDGVVVAAVRADVHCGGHEARHVVQQPVLRRRGPCSPDHEPPLHLQQVRDYPPSFRATTRATTKINSTTLASVR